MLTRHLKYFVTLAEMQHFGRAAEACNVTQPTMSQAIRKLEEDLGFPLSEDMQNRRILNHIAASAGVSMRPHVVSNSFLGVASHLKNGACRAIVPHSFGYLFGDMPDLALREMIEPVRRQLIGLVLSHRDPQSPMSGALQECAAHADMQRHFDAAAAGRAVAADQPG